VNWAAGRGAGWLGRHGVAWIAQARHVADRSGAAGVARLGWFDEAW
jgi:hypothetical protein